MTARGHRQIDHTADLALELWAPTRGELFVEGALALVEQLTDGAELDGDDVRAVALDATDDAEVLVVWLNEVLYWAVTEGYFVTGGALVVENGKLRGQVRGVAGAGDRLASELKSVTYHHLALERTDAGWLGRVVIDV